MSCVHNIIRGNPQLQVLRFLLPLRVVRWENRLAYVSVPSDCPSSVHCDGRRSLPFSRNPSRSLYIYEYTHQCWFGLSEKISLAIPDVTMYQTRLQDDSTRLKL